LVEPHPGDVPGGGALELHPQLDRVGVRARRIRRYGGGIPDGERAVRRGGGGEGPGGGGGPVGGGVRRGDGGGVGGRVRQGGGGGRGGGVGGGVVADGAGGDGVAGGVLEGEADRPRLHRGAERRRHRRGPRHANSPRGGSGR